MSMIKYEEVLLEHLAVGQVWRGNADYVVVDTGVGFGLVSNNCFVPPAAVLCELEGAALIIEQVEFAAVKHGADGLPF